MKYRLAIVVLGILTTNASAVTSFGNYDCGQWFTRSSAARIWLLGYLSGLASADSTTKIDVLDRLNSADQAHLWMDNYCKNNPLKKVNEGAMELYMELSRKS